MAVNHKLNNLNILNWNAYGISNKKLELYNFLREKDINIACISETRLKPDINFTLPGFKVYRHDRTTNIGGGVALILKTKLKHKDVPDLKLKIIEAKGIDVQTDLGTLRVISIYRNFNAETAQMALDFEHDLKKLSSFKGSFIIVGDFNAKHISWQCAYNNKNGRILKDLQNDGHFVVIPPDKPTHFSNNGVGTFIDLVLTNIPDLVINSETLEELPSDHFPTITSLNLSKLQSPDSSRFNYKKANWPKYKNIFNTLLNMDLPIDSPSDIDIALQHFVSCIKEAESQSIPFSKDGLTTDLNLDHITQHLIRVRNSKRRLYNEIGDPRLKSEINQIQKIVQKRLNKLKNDNFSNDISKFSNRSKPFWRITKVLRNRPKPIPPFKEGTDILLTDKEKCEALSTHFLKSHQINLSAKSPQDIPVKTSIQSLQMSPSIVPIMDKISVNQITNIVKSFKNYKAPGIDAVMSITVKQLPKEAFQFLAKVFNKCLEFCHFPTLWKEAKIIPILKAGKDPSQASNYRPISLLSCISKIFEKLILNRLENHIFDSNIYIEEQFGFRSGHSTTQQLERVITHIKTGLRTKKTTIMALLDIEKAFDSVWHDGLIHKISQFGFPIYLTKTLMSYLNHRTYKVHLYGSHSNSQTIPAGVPQGSVLGPVLYNIFTSDFPDPPDHCHRAIYADDTALYATGIGTRNTIPKLQKYINTCTKYYSTWKITPNAAKTEVIRFNGSNHKRPLRLFKKITVNGNPIDWSTSVKYLGLTIDKNLNFYQHTIQTLKKVNWAKRLLFPLLNRRSQLSETNKLAIYCQILRPIMTYAAPVWKNISAARRKKFQTVQNQSLKMAFRLHPYTRTLTVRNLTKVPLLSDFIQSLDDKFRASMTNSNYDIIRGIHPQ